MVLGHDECWFDVKALFAGLNVPAPQTIADQTRAEQIFENNLVAQVAQTARDVLLGIPTDASVPLRPVCGLTYRVRGTRLFTVPNDQQAQVSRSNENAIAAPRIAFRRAIALMYGVELIDAGMFVWEGDNQGNRRLSSYQFNTGTLSVHYDAVHVREDNVEELRRLFGALTHGYMKTEGEPLGVAIDRLGRAGIRWNAIDANLDLCIAAEIAFLFGVRRDIDNERIAETVRQNARAFFGEGEFHWNRDEVAAILRASYRERSDTVHGRRFSDPERLTNLMRLNVQLREVLRATLQAYVVRRPARLVARALWPERQALLERGDALGPIFL